ncbi:MAG: Gfo/Idh/MocA family oxidoreductase [Candidatus Caenarcaniphilales bacterium]|nr:Gfo/Idh/MocA family oxidoreductase [Candidatus Caenarcaniphilales bacterium]
MVINFFCLGVGDIALGQYLPYIKKRYPNSAVTVYEPSDEAFLKASRTNDINRARTQEELIKALSLNDYLLILSPSRYHAEQLSMVAESKAPAKILCEKPIGLNEQERMRLLQLSEKGALNNCFFADHWYPRVRGISYLLGLESIRPTGLISSDEQQERFIVGTLHTKRLTRIEGNLVEKSYLDSSTNLRYPLSFMGGDFSRAEEIFKYPNGVLTDTLIHPMNAICCALGLNGLTSQNMQLWDRHGQSIQKGDFENGEAKACLQGSFTWRNQAVKFQLLADKLAEEDNKGITLHFDDGTQLVLRCQASRDTTSVINKNGEEEFVLSDEKQPYELLLDWFFSGCVFKEDKDENSTSLALWLNYVQLNNLASIFKSQGDLRGAFSQP